MEAWSTQTTSVCTSEASDYEKLYTLDVLGVEDRGEDDQSDVLNSFKERVKRGVDGRYEVSVPWIPGISLYSTNEQPSRRRLIRVQGSNLAVVY